MARTAAEEITGVYVAAALADYGIKGRIMRRIPGPVVSRFEVELAPGTSVSAVERRARDLGMALGTSVSIVPASGRNMIGLEVSNPQRALIDLKPLLESPEFVRSRARLPILIGITPNGRPLVADLAEMPHLLIAGATGSGKTTGLHCLIVSMLFKRRPDQLRLILADPKGVDLIAYAGIPHLLTPVIDQPQEILAALAWARAEMDRRQDMLKQSGSSDISMHNSKVAPPERLPHIVVVVEEFADLMLSGAAGAISDTVQALAGKARFAGIHLIMATQRPSVDVVTGVIKANLRAKMCFMVSYPQDSRTVLGYAGAEALTGRGDMLVDPADSIHNAIQLSKGARFIRAHAPYIDRAMVDRVAAEARKMGAPEYAAGIMLDEDYSREYSRKSSNPCMDIQSTRPKMTLMEWLRMAVDGEPKKVADLLQEGWDIGRWPDRTIYDAKKALGIEHFRRDGAAYWQFPTRDPRPATRDNGSVSAVSDTPANAASRELQD